MGNYKRAAGNCGVGNNLMLPDQRVAHRKFAHKTETECSRYYILRMAYSMLYAVHALLCAAYATSFAVYAVLCAAYAIYE